MIKLRDEGDDVTKLQADLAEAGYLPAWGVDGDFGPQTDKALRAFQRSKGLVADGIAGPKTLAALRNQDVTKLLSQDDIEAAADKLGVEVAAMLAINEVESRGEGFLPDGRPVILFERHVMEDRLTDQGVDASYWQGIYPNIVNTRSGGYKGNEKEWERLGMAWSIHPVVSVESASWGVGQVMGYHWKRLGYDSAQAFVDAMRENEGNQFDAVARFIKADTVLLRALQNLEWLTVATRYNGPQHAKNDWAPRLQAAYDRHSAALESSS